MKKKSPFQKPNSIERKYASILRGVAKEIGRIIGIYKPEKPDSLKSINATLVKYSDMIREWAEVKSADIISDIIRHDSKAWVANSENLSRSMRQRIQSAPIGQAVRKAQQLQVELITSLPLQAAERVQHLANEAIYSGARASSLTKEILRTGEVTEGRARTIARTETSRASSLLVQARAEAIGSEGYIWTTSHDSDVRPSHKKMDGQFVRWDSPPTLDGLTGHAGTLPNCRCFQVPVIPKHLED